MNKNPEPNHNAAFWDRYLQLAHAVQTGASYTLQTDPSGGNPKHLRTGLNLSKIEHGALARLLIQKGIITQDEYEASILEGLEDEIRRTEAELSKHYGGVKITLG